METTTPTKRGPKGPLTDEHKAALAQGRAESAIVKVYLESLRDNKPRRGRRRTPDSINNRLAGIETELGDADVIQQLRLIQERMDLTAELAAMASAVVVDESAFVGVARSYSERVGISWEAWRQVGVEADVLRRAGVAK